MKTTYLLFVAIGLLIANSAFACDRPIGPEDFCGTYRAGPKTSFYKTLAPFEHFDTLKGLLASLPSDDEMRHDFDWSLQAAPDQRVAAEAHNVEVTGYLLAVKPGESDRDFHVIISNDSTGSDQIFMNVEVSGLPVDHVDEADFERARSEIRKIVPEVDHESGHYIKLNGIKVVVRGSLYFDGDHSSGCGHCPGPSYAKPQTVWEIHPVYSIKPQ